MIACGVVRSEVDRILQHHRALRVNLRLPLDNENRPIPRPRIGGVEQDGVPWVDARQHGVALAVHDRQAGGAAPRGELQQAFYADGRHALVYMTGRIMGRAVRAAHTVTFIGLKPGLFTLDGVDQCGEVHLRTLGVDAAAVVAARGSLLDAGILDTAFPPRRSNTHKGTYGSLGIIGGAPGMVGAAWLAGRSALHLGTGRVYVGTMGSGAPTIDPLQPELMLRAADAVLKLEHLTALAVGPGLGQSAAAKGLLKNAIRADIPVVFDADALNLLAQEAIMRRAFVRRSAPSVITPHPAEAARLLGCSTTEVQNRRIDAAVELAARLRCEVVLKGAGSVCASADGSYQINTSGNPGLAAAGQGDVLTGMVGALLAQGCSPATALRAAVHLHGAAADDLVASGTGPVGLTASDVLLAARARINRRA